MHAHDTAFEGKCRFLPTTDILFGVGGRVNFVNLKLVFGLKMCKTTNLNQKVKMNTILSLG